MKRHDIAILLADTVPASDTLIETLAESVQARRIHRHPVAEDAACDNLVRFLGGHMAYVLKRLIDVESEAGRDLDRLAAAVGWDMWEPGGPSPVDEAIRLIRQHREAGTR